MTVLHIQRLLYYWRYLFPVLELDASYDWHVIAPNTHCSPFPISHCAYLHAWELENYRTYMDVLHIEQLLYYRRHSFVV